MIRLLTFIFILSASAQAAILGTRPDAVTTNTAAPVRITQEQILFRNGDILAGSLRGISPANIVWQHPDAATPIELDKTHLSEVQLKAEPRGASGTPNDCVVQLTNGDQLDAELISLTESNLNVRTWFAGELTIPRSMLAAINPSGPSRSTIFSGPTTIEGWTPGQTNALHPGSGKWIYRNGAFYASKSASLARDVKLPDVSSLSFDMTWKGYFQMAIALYTDRLQPVSLANKEAEPNFGGFYSLQLNTFSANLLPITHKDPIRYLGQASMLALSQKNSAHFDIRTHKHKKTIALLVNGELVKEWSDPAPFAGAGTAIRFVHQGQGLIKIENLVVAEWDGTYEEKNAPAPPQDQDLARLRNGDRVLGAVSKIENGQLTITRPEGKMDFPLARAKRIEFALRRRATTPNDSSTLRAHFPRGGSLTLSVDEWTAEGFRASSPAFGPAKIHPHAFSRLEFPAVN